METVNPLKATVMRKETYAARIVKEGGGKPWPKLSHERISQCLRAVALHLQRGEHKPAHDAIDNALDVNMICGAEPLTMDSHVEELGLDAQVIGHLDKLGVVSIGDLQRVKEADLLALTGFGPVHLAELRAAMERACTHLVA